MRQTTVQEANTIRFGSGVFEVGADVGSLTNLGAMRNIVFEETWDKVRVMSDNAGEIVVGIRNHRAALAGDLMEINLANLNIIRGGIDSYSTVAGSEVSGEDQVILQGSWSFETFVELNGQMYNGTAPNATAVVGSEDGALAVGNDYNIVKNAAGKWGIILHEDGTTLATESQNITVTSTYTPAASKSLKSGGKVTMTAKVARVTNYNEDDEKFQITVYKATAEEGINIELQADDAEDPAMTSIRMTGTLDTAKDAGEQLFEIYDEQGV